MPDHVEVFFFDDAPIVFFAGESVGASLMRDGILALRVGRSGRACGLYCGIGVCNECLTICDGRPNTRACMTKAEVGLRVKHQQQPVWPE
jgi:predicted molibdopterin-dependent oxidoreductase YjgC